MACHGHGCPFTTRRWAARTGSHSLVGIPAGTELSAGTTIELRITRGKKLLRRAIITIRARRSPLRT